MKPGIKYCLIVLLITTQFTISCKKEMGPGNQSGDPQARAHKTPKGKNRPPIANAGADATITLPGLINLDGTKSTDPDNNIASYAWTKISGPSSFTIANANAVYTQVTNLVTGVYQFELKVTDTWGLFSKDIVQLTVNPESISPPPCTTNCGKIVFVSARDGNNEIYTCNADGSNIIRLTNDPATDEYPAWSADGTKIAFVRNGNICIMNADGSDVVQKTFSGDCYYPAWSPDGMKIAYGAVYVCVSVIDLASGSISQLGSIGSSIVSSPAWSPDGTKIAFEIPNDFHNRSDLFTILPNGGGLTLLTPTVDGDYDYWKPTWSPNGTKLSVSIHRMNSATDAGSIGLMNVDGSGLTIIKTGIPMAAYNETRTSWSPAGTIIAYTANNTIKWVAADGSAAGTIIANGWDADWSH